MDFGVLLVPDCAARMDDVHQAGHDVALEAVESKDMLVGPTYGAFESLDAQELDCLVVQRNSSALQLGATQNHFHNAVVAGDIVKAVD